MQATYHAKGLIVFRSGRLHMYRHYLGKHCDWPSLQLRDWAEGRTTLIGGTSVSVIIPWMETAQLDLALR